MVHKCLFFSLKRPKSAVRAFPNHDCHATCALLGHPRNVDNTITTKLS